MRVASLAPLFRPLKIGAAALALGALSACATPGFRADVARFQQMPAPQGQTFSIEPRDESLRGGLEFNHYAGLVTEQLTRYGYRAAPAGGLRLRPALVRAQLVLGRGTQFSRISLRHARNCTICA